jgi:sigma-E factor negative regulatory protein RseB
MPRSSVMKSAIRVRVILDPRGLYPICCKGLMARLYVVLTTITLFCSAEATADDRSAADQLARMADAMRSLSYEGTLVYLHDNRLETLRIEHRIEEGRAHERLFSLNGPLRTVTRDQDGVTCELPNSHPISIHRRGLAQEVLRSKSIDADVLAAHYLVHPLGVARVAGRQTDVVGIIPRDNLRYGYRFYLDSESGLPLKSDLMGEQAEPIEQIMFTSLELLSTENASVTLAASSDEPARKRQPRGVQDSGVWRFVELPPGFELVMYDQVGDGDGKPVEHFVLSDGLASVSVYVEGDEAEGLDGSTRIGAVHAAGGRVAGYQVTVVGEVPEETVKDVLAGIRPAAEGRP